MNWFLTRTRKKYFFHCLSLLLTKIGLTPSGINTNDVFICFLFLNFVCLYVTVIVREVGENEMLKIMLELLMVTRNIVKDS